MPDGQKAMVRIAAFGKVGRAGNGCECAVRAEEHVLRRVFGDQRMPVARKQNRDGMSAEQGLGGEVRADAKELFAANAGGGKIDVLDDVVQRDVREEAGSARKSGRRKAEECGNGRVRSCKAREDEVEPDHIGLDLADGAEKANRRGYAAKLPAANHVEVPGARAARHLEGVAMFIGSEVVVGQLVGQNGQFDIGIALKLPRNMKCVFIQLPPAGRKCCDQTDFHRFPPSE